MSVCRLISYNSQKLIFEIYDASDSDAAAKSISYDQMDASSRSDFDDEDKIFFKKIGKTEIAVDKILQNLLDDDVSSLGFID